MSVVVHPDFQGLGLSRQLLRAFIARMRELGKARIHLMCKERHVPLYQRFGFVYIKRRSRTTAAWPGTRWCSRFRADIGFAAAGPGSERQRIRRS